MGKLYFDVVGDVPNSVVWNDGTRDILAWVPGETPLTGLPVQAEEGSSQVIAPGCGRGAGGDGSRHRGHSERHRAPAVPAQ